jgi:hypothetical protein
MVARLPDAELERFLFEIGTRLEEPPSGHLAAAVGARLRAGPVAKPRVLAFRQRPAFGGPARWRTVAVAAAAVLAVVAGTLVFSPGARRAVAGWLGLRGVRIEVSPAPPGGTTPSPGPAPNLGPEVSRAEAERQMGFRVLLPDRPGLGPPDEIHVQPLFISEQVFLVYESRPGIPATDATGFGLLVSEFRGRADADFYKKVSAGSGSVEFVTVNGGDGFWIEGLHSVSYLDPKGRVVQDSTRIADNVLIWEQGDLTLRLESALSRDQALGIARSFG